MKNFTNNFKQLTSRLSARWLIMALMMLVGTSSVWAANYTIYFEKPSGWGADIYFCIGKSNWTDFDNKMTHICGNYYKITISWDGAEKIGFTDCNLSSWSDNNESIDSRYAWVCNNKTPLTKSIATNRMYYMSGESITYKTQSSAPTCVTTYTVKKSETGTTGGTVKLGTTTLSTSDTSMDAGTYDLSITAPNGYNVSKVEVSGGSLTTAGTTGSSSYTGKVNVSANTTVTVTYARITYTVKKAETGATGGTVKLGTTTLSTTAASINSGSYDLSITAPTGYNVSTVTVSGGSLTTAGTTGSSTYSGTVNVTAATTITITYAEICYQSATEGTGSFSNGTITLSAKFNTCGSAYIGFQWKKQDDIDWCYTNDGTEKCYKALGEKNKSNAVEETSFTKINNEPLSGSYVFRPYIVVGNDAKNWLYGEAFTVSTCVSVVEPAVSMSPADGAVCQGSSIELTLTTRQSGVVYTIGNEEIFENTTTHSFEPNTNSVTVTASHENACDGTNDKTKKFDISIKSLPEVPTFESNSMTVCEGEPFSLPTPTNLKVGIEDCIWSVGGKTTTGSQPGISQTTDYTAVKNDGCSSSTVQFTVNVTPKPTITASKTSCAPYEEIMLSSAAGAGTTWEATGGMLSATSGESVTFKAAPAGTPYTVAASANGCTDTETITVECAEEDCSGAQSTDVIITCDPNGYTGDVYCHIWPYGGDGIAVWPGTKGTKVDGIWTWTFSGLNSNTTYDLILNGGDGKGKTNDIDQNAVPGNKYDYTLVYDNWSNNGKSNMDPVSPTVISTAINPTVTTVSAEQKEGEAAVVIKGFLQATGCADITKYGYQYRVSGSGDYTDVQVTGSKNICDEWIVECGDLEYGETYDFCAKATNEGGGKGYGKVIQVTIQGQSTPVVIKAVRNDKTVNESHWADFVALYVQEDGIAAAGATEVKNYTWEYSTDGTDWVTNFTGYVLGGASATVGVTNGSEKCNNIRPTKTGKYRVKVTYDNDAVQESNIITITSDDFKLKYPEYGQNAGSDFAFEAASRTIPVFVVKTTENFPDCPASGMPSQDVEGQKAKKSVDVKIFDNGNVVYDRKARMNYRGSSSLNFRKKSYAFCTGKEKTKNSNGDVDTGKENLFGLSNGAKDKDWVLYAAMPDPSMMRNRLIFDTYAQMTGKWGVESKFVELIIDDEYMGVYVLMDKITKNANRINITAADGFILKFDKTDVTDRFEDENSEKRNTFTTEKTGKSGIGSYGATFDQRFEIEYPEMEDADSEEKWVEFVNDNVKGKIEAFEKALEAGNYTEVRKLIDYESWADWFIISEFAKNVDAYRASCFFVYNGDKIEARPLWDQELSFDNKSTSGGSDKGCDNTSGLLIQNAAIYSDDFPAPFWFTGGGASITGGLLNDPCFVSMVKNRYKDHLNNALSNGQLTGKISEYQTELTDAAKTRETNTWRPGSGNIYSCNGGDTSYDYVSITNSITAMNNWITNRPAKLTTALDALTGSSVNISIEPSFVETYPWEPFTLTVDAPEGYEYEMTFTKEGTDATSNMVIEKGGDIYTVKIKRPANTVNQVFETVPYLATATLQVADDGCGGMTTPEANVNIRLNDREEDCE